MIIWQGIKTDGKHEEDDFLITPTLAFGFSKHDEPEKSLFLRGFGIGIKWGYWGVFYAIYWKKPNNGFNRTRK